MTTQAHTVRDHYQAAISDRQTLLERITKAVDAMAVPIDSRCLAPIDQFHMGGLAATAEFAKRIGIVSGARVLDAGAGLGGPARFLAESFGAHVEGVDLAPDYVAIANLLTERAGLSHLVKFCEGDLAALPFDDAQFDLVWTQHVSMNIADRTDLYREFRRVLKVGGRLAFYDPLATDGRPDLIYPVPWAQSAETSTLLTLDETRTSIEQAGFSAIQVEDVTQEAIAWAQQQGSPAQPGAVNAAMIVGARMAEMAGNFSRNLREDRVRLVIGIFDAI